MDIIQLAIDKISPYESNPRNNDCAVDAVSASIKEFGFKVPIIIDKNNIVIAGHTRLKAAIQLGLDTVPVVMADDLSPEQAQAFRLADNKTSDLSAWDFSLLSVELDELANAEFDMEPENRLRSMGDGLACCGFGDLEGFEGNNFNLVHIWRGENPKPTAGMLKPKTADCFHTINQNTLDFIRLKNATFANEMLNQLAKEAGHSGA